MSPGFWLQQQAFSGDKADSQSPRGDAGAALDGDDVAAGEGNREVEPRGVSTQVAGEGSGQGIALVVDQEVTSYLMMGALSPGIKRHAVSLFEGKVPD